MELSRPAASDDDSLDDQQAVDATLPRADEDDAPSLSSRSGSTTLQEDLDADVGPFREPTRYRNALGRFLAYLQHGKELVFSERISALLLFVPLGITIGFLEFGPILEFILNALAIIPLAVVISSATENLAGRLGDTFGALLNVTVGNSAELMIFYVALTKNQIRIVQASLLGSVLVNSLLVLGTALVCGGLRFKDKMRDRPAVRLSVALLDLGLLISIYPIAFWIATTKAETDIVKSGVLALSRGTSIFLIFIYLVYLTIQMRSRSLQQRKFNAGELGAIPLATMSRNGVQLRAWGSNTRDSQDTPRRLDLRARMNLIKWPRWLPRVSRHRDVGRHADVNAGRSLLRRTTRLDDLENAGLSPRSPSVASTLSELESHTVKDRSSHPECRASNSPNPQRGHRPMNSLSWKLPPSPPTTVSDDDDDDEEEEEEEEEEDTPRGRRLLSAQDAANQRLANRSDGLGRPVASSRIETGYTGRSTLRDLYEHQRSRSRQTGTPLAVSLIVLVLAAVLASICSEIAVSAIPEIVESAKSTQIFIGFIVLPVVGNAAEHVTAAKLAMHDKFVLAKSVAIESSTQVVLLITPAMILLGWARNRELSLQFDLYEIASVVVASIVASLVVSCGKGGWRQGVLMYSIFGMIAIGAIVYPTIPALYGRQGFSHGLA